MACVGPIVAVVAFVLMQLAYGAVDEGPYSLLFEIAGFGLFAVWLAGVVVAIVGIVGVIAWFFRHPRSI